MTPDEAHKLISPSPKRPNGDGADFVDVTAAATEAQQETLRRFQALLEQVKSLAAGDDQTLGVILKNAVNDRLSEAQV
jgi:hypothetical protein